ncbi:NAD(P)-dependent alcohol dehydrogenase [Chitinimonas sp.]|uniref:zinc-dependent alcohol dehydrogenase family protein n=1 Tax=Chitinimonas sp. TaxID=1934313 RepID=UPI0035B2AA21
MQAYHLKQFGIDHLQQVDLPMPQPGQGEVLLRVGAVSLNYRDRVVAEGNYLPDMPLPFIPVSDGAGVVAAVGAGVTRWQVGQRATTQYTTNWMAGRMVEAHQKAKLGGPLPGMLREYAVLHEQSLVATPAHLSDAEASTLPIAAVTAWNALMACELRAGQTVLLQGTGSVSLFALQLARIMGARVIITSSSDAKLARAHSLGAHHTINYRDTPDWGQAARDVLGGEGVDAVLEVGGAGTLAQSAHAVRQDGSIALIGFLGGFGGGPEISRALMYKRARLLGTSVGHRESFEAMNRAIDLHQLRPVIDRQYAFADAPAAYRQLVAGDSFGKIVITI